MAAEAATGRVPERLQTPPIPACFERHLRIWGNLHRRRRATDMGGLLPFSWEALAAYCQVTGEVLGRADVQIVEAIEEEFFEARAAGEERRTKAEARRADAKSNRPGNRR